MRMRAVLPTPQPLPEQSWCVCCSRAPGACSCSQLDASSTAVPIRYVSHVFSGGAKCTMTGAERTAEVGASGGRGWCRSGEGWAQPSRALTVRARKLLGQVPFL